MDITEILKQPQVNIKDAAKILGYSVRWVREAVRNERLKVYRNGSKGQLKFKPRELLVSLENNFEPIKILEKKKKL